MKKYKISFSPLGLILFMIPMIPNLYWAIVPPKALELLDNEPVLPIFGVLQEVCRFLMIGLLIMVVNTNRQNTSHKKWFMVIGTLCMLAYFISWVVYYNSIITPYILMAMAVLPTIYFICACLYQENYLAFCPAILFGGIHITTTAINYL